MEKFCKTSKQLTEFFKKNKEARKQELRAIQTSRKTWRSFENFYKIYINVFLADQKNN